MYRRALAASWASHAASWASQPGELPADECVEEIFVGGDGWKPDSKLGASITQDTSGEDSNSHGNHRNHSGASTKSQNTVTGNGSGRFGHRNARSKDTTDHGTGIQNSLEETSSENSERGRTGLIKVTEVDELHVRDDLMAWRLPEKVS